MGIFSYIFIASIILIYGLKKYLNKRQLNSIKNNFTQVPIAFQEKINLFDHQKAANYSIAKLKLDNKVNLINSLVLLAFTLGGGIEVLNNFFYFPAYLLTSGMAIIVVMILINIIINLPISLYATFKIEQHFGFNKMTIGVFIKDTIKSLTITLIIGIPLIYLILWLMNVMGENWWIWVWLVFIAFNLIILTIYPTIIAPLFNKFIPLEDLELKTKIEILLAKCGFKSNGIFVMDGSKRSSHGNAYFTGIGKSKRIVFFDTLIKQLNHEEIIAVLAHELGHFKYKHILKQMLISFSFTLVVLFALNMLINQAWFYNQLGVTTTSNANGLILFFLIINLLSLPLAPLLNYFSRKNEFEADNFAKLNANKHDLISGLIKMFRDNASTLTPDELYVKFYYSHPPATTRIKNLAE